MRQGHRLRRDGQGRADGAGQFGLLDEGDLAAELGISEDGELEGFGFGDTASNGDGAEFGEELADVPAAEDSDS